MRSILLSLLVACVAAACGSPPLPPASSSPKEIAVVAGEDSWGNIASQLGGDRVHVESVVSDPNADPHEYESNTNDARAFATARLVVLNGAGYDDWGKHLLDANPSSDRRVLTVAQLLGKKAGDNPHFWYQPDYVARVADGITAEYKAIDPGGASYFDQRRSGFTAALEPYAKRLAEIKAKFAGVPVGATESIFVYLAAYLGLDLVSPPGFMQAVSEGIDPAASAVAQFQDQVASRAIRVLVYNVQTDTAVTTNLKLQAARSSIPLVGVSETLQPETATFEEWQDRQLVALEAALVAGG
ncbi:MAG TPA: zinc ABC transporter substrate-binding protein [Candidatus Dormibacteraeota bacterium]|nr:zinc ABC transporter substrate-binding protein [Candidatus Dormibacteraeota bacterium]